MRPELKPLLDYLARLTLDDLMRDAAAMQAIAAEHQDNAGDVQVDSGEIKEQASGSATGASPASTRR